MEGKGDCGAPPLSGAAPALLLDIGAVGVAEEEAIPAKGALETAAVVQWVTYSLQNAAQSRRESSRVE